MPVDAPTPVPTRPSDLERERVVDSLRRSAGEGRLSIDTLSGRVEHAYGARTRPELEELLLDLPEPSLGRRLLSRAAAGLSRLTAEVEASWREPRTPRLQLPSTDRSDLTIGRGRECDCVLSDRTVSRHHARLRRREGSWLLSDLGSTNGTRVNGWRVVEEIEVRPGDRVTFGSVRYRLTGPRTAGG